MRIFPHFSVVGFCNTYVVGPSEGGSAIVIDPGHVDEGLVDLLVSHDYTVDHVLLTHSHQAHGEGVGTLRKIWNPVVHAANPSLFPFPVEKVEDNETLLLSGFTVRTLLVPGHSLDSMVYCISHAIFSGDTLECGRTGTTNGYREQGLLIGTIEERLMSLDENFLLFPGHGTISKIRIERMFNQDLLKLRMIEKTRSLWRGEE